MVLHSFAPGCKDAFALAGNRPTIMKVALEHCTHPEKFNSTSLTFSEKFRSDDDVGTIGVGKGSPALPFVNFFATKIDTSQMWPNLKLSNNPKHEKFMHAWCKQKIRSDEGPSRQVQQEAPLLEVKILSPLSSQLLLILFLHSAQKMVPLK